MRTSGRVDVDLGHAVRTFLGRRSLGGFLRLLHELVLRCIDCLNDGEDHQRDQQEIDDCG